MGKKSGKKRPIAEIEEDIDEAENEELQAEIAALEAMTAEQTALTVSSSHQAHSYNKAALLQYVENLESIDCPFLETLQIGHIDIDVTDENDDIEREMAFYNHALLAVEHGRKQLTTLGVPHKRPDDYFAESVKSDAHMARIKDKLILEEKKMDAFEQRKQRELNRKYNKQVSAMRKAEKSQMTKAEIEASKHMRSSDEADERGPLSRKGVRDGVKSSRRIAMDKKYGSGGRDKKRAKLTDKKSLNDFSDYNPRGGKLIRRDKRGGSSGSGAGGKGGKNGGNRPGKSTRDRKRAGRK